ncbi:MAG: hypothetical protein A2Z34_04510 [Planctomycetes bacterium RBG_16_59_8]|nr:MAG: hypothetical protein A2Z34_04510 [Planctomycetes bacterium RBG_16_59_8]
MRQVVERTIFGFAYPFALLIKLLSLLGRTARESFASRRRGRNAVSGEVIKQIYFTGVQALWIVSAIAAVVGVATGLQIAVILQTIGNPALVNQIFFNLIIRELAPLAAAIIVVGRSGSAVTVELATLTVSRELETYRAMGVNIFHFILFPRMVGITVATIVLSAWFAAVAILSGGFLVSLQSDLPLTTFLARVTGEGQYVDMYIFFAKGVVNGLSIALISCYMGLRVRGSLTEIPRAASSAMIVCGFSTLLLSGLISLLAYV